MSKGRRADMCRCMSAWCHDITRPLPYLHYTSVVPADKQRKQAANDERSIRPYAPLALSGRLGSRGGALMLRIPRVEAQHHAAIFPLIKAHEVLQRQRLKFHRIDLNHDPAILG